MSSSRPDYVTTDALETFIERALQEDVGSGDLSTLASVPPEIVADAELISKDTGILAGVDMAKAIYEHVDKDLSLQIEMRDGDTIKPGDKVFHLSGSARSILTAERLVLNCIQRMSGIATKTRHMVDMIQNTGSVLKDTRKTTPSFRMAEKWAVHIGGGANHRFGLFDMIMLKDNHQDYAGGLTKALSSTRAFLQEQNIDVPIEVETRSLEEVKEVLKVGGVDIVMLDNMSVEDMKKAVDLINRRFLVEASGNITETNIREVATSGVDYISVGALTHSYKSLDLSLKASVPK